MKRSYLSRLSEFHLGPGDHPNGSSQEVHGGKRAGAGANSMSSLEKQIRNQKFETAGVFYKDGKLLFKKDGDANHVNFTQGEVMMMRDMTLTHNHPSGGTFSLDDYDLFMHAKLKQIRAVSNEYTYILTAPDGYDYTRVDRFAIGHFQRQAKESGYGDHDWREWNHATSEYWADSVGLKYERVKNA